VIVPWPPAGIDGEPVTTETRWLPCGCAVNHPVSGHGGHPAPVWTYGPDCPLGHREPMKRPAPETHMGYKGDTCPCCNGFVPSDRLRDHLWDCVAELKSERDSLFARLTALEAS